MRAPRRLATVLLSLLLVAWQPEPSPHAARASSDVAVPSEGTSAGHQQPMAAYPWFYLRDCAPVTADETPAEAVIVGDILLGRGVSPADDPLADVAPWLRSADLAVGNLEGAVTSTPADCAQTHPASYQLVMSPPAVTALRDAGFDLLSLANNHALDCGPAGLATGVTLLREAGITPLGAADGEDPAPPVIRTVRGVRLAWLAFNRVPYPAGFGSLAADVAVADAVAAIKSTRPTVDALIVLIHWGYEYQHRPDPAQEAAARAMMAAGADLVVGHHPHVVQPLVAGADPATGGSVTAYSLGNFVFDQQFGTTDAGLALRALFDSDGLRALQAMPVHAGPHPRLMSPAAAAPLLARLGLRSQPTEPQTAFACGHADPPSSGSAAADYCRTVANPQTACGEVSVPSGGTSAVVRPAPRGGIFSQGAIDLTGDGLAEVVQLHDGRVSVLAPETASAESGVAALWRSDAAWHVVDVAIGDPNDDGRGELLLAMWKPDGDGVPRSHPFIIGYREGIYRTLWGGSAVVQPLREVEVGDIDGDGIQELIVLDDEKASRQGTIAVWRWHGWGFSLLWRSPPGLYQNLALAAEPGSDRALISVTTSPSSDAGELGE